MSFWRTSNDGMKFAIVVLAGMSGSTAPLHGACPRKQLRQPGMLVAPLIATLPPRKTHGLPSALHFEQAVCMKR